jgi:hypothetical protein
VRLPPPAIVAVAVAATAVLAAAPPATVVLGGASAARHVLAITGTSEHGFHVQWSDGQQWWTPTLSETVAECGEYDRAVRRARCTSGARTRYRWMGIVKRSLHHVTP